MCVFYRHPCLEASTSVIASIIASITLAVEATTLSYVLSIKHRLTKLETFQEIHNGKTKKGQPPQPAESEERAL